MGANGWPSRCAVLIDVRARQAGFPRWFTPPPGRHIRGGPDRAGVAAVQPLALRLGNDAAGAHLALGLVDAGDLGLAAGLAESQYAYLQVEAVPHMDAIVVLGGAFSGKRSWPYPSAGGSVDKRWHVTRLYDASGGSGSC